MKKKDFKIRISLSFEKVFYELLKEKAKKDYVLVATWIQQFLQKNLLDNKDEEDYKCEKKDGK